MDDWNLEFFDPLNLSGIYGLPRHGKTTELVREMKEAYDRGYEIVTNVILNENYFKEYVLLNPEKPEIFLKELKSLIKMRSKQRDFHPTYLGIDQLSAILDAQSRISETKEFNELWINLGKVGITTCHTNQNIDMTIKRYRTNMERYKIITKNDDESYFISLYFQTVRSCEEYINVYEKGFLVNRIELQELFDTHQVMYL